MILFSILVELMFVLSWNLVHMHSIFAIKVKYIYIYNIEKKRKRNLMWLET